MPKPPKKRQDSMKPGLRRMYDIVKDIQNDINQAREEAETFVNEYKNQYMIEIK